MKIPALCLMSLLLSMISISADEPEARDSDEKREVLGSYLKYIRAIRENDRTAALAFLPQNNTKPDEQCVLALDLVLASNALQDRLISRFGAMGAAKLPGPSDAAIMEIERNIADSKTKIEVESDVARITRVPEKPGPIEAIGLTGDVQVELRRSGRTWVIAPPMPHERGTKQEIETVKAMTAFLMALTEKAADKSATPEELRRQVEKFLAGLSPTSKKTEPEHGEQRLTRPDSE